MDTPSTAHRRVGAAAVASFLALLLLGALHGRAVADPAAAPVPVPSVNPAPPERDGRDPGFPRERGPRGGGDRGFGGGGGAAPAPSTGEGNTT